MALISLTSRAYSALSSGGGGGGRGAGVPLSVGPPGPYVAGGAAGEWEQAFDTTTNAPYWVNRNTGAFSWTQPF